MTWGEASSEKEGHWQLNEASSQGINFIDTAEMYPTNPLRRETAGLTETIIGNWLSKKKSRTDYVIATKIVGKGAKTVRDGEEISGKGIVSALNLSLKRLKTDYIDLYQLHWPNRGSYHFRKYWEFNPSLYSNADMDDHLYDVLYTVSDLIKEGKIRALGLSNETAWGSMKFIEFAKRHNLPKVASIQNEYSLLCRLYDTDLSEISKTENIPLLSYSPLAAGLLTGKYQNGNIPNNSRLQSSQSLGNRIGSNTFEAVNHYLQIAKRHNIDPIHMSLAFCASRPFMGSVIFGATRNSQLVRILKGLNTELSLDILQEISLAFRKYPMPI